MIVGLCLVVVMLISSWIKSSSARGDEAAGLPAEGLGMTETVHLPEIDAARIDAMVGDADVRTRVVLESDAKDELLGDARRLTPAGFDALGIRPLDAAALDELRRNPSAHRGEAFSARGEVMKLETRVNPKTGEEEDTGLLNLEGGGQVWFLALEVSDLGSFVRVDGLFLKNYRAEDDGERWVDAPFLVAPRAVRSYPALGNTTELDQALLGQVRDDVLSFDDGSQPRITGIPFDALWNMMDYVEDLPEGAIDWESVPILDDVVMAAMLRDGARFRAKPFRLPISRLQGVRVKRAGENPARLASYTEGWIGNATWNNVVHFRCPREHRELALGDYMTGRGFFLKDFAYESAGRGLRIAPVLVLDDLTEFVPTEDPTLRRLAYLVAACSAVLITGLILLVRRDRRRSRRIQAELFGRQRKRRAQGPALVPPVDPGS